METGRGKSDSLTVCVNRVNAASRRRRVCFRAPLLVRDLLLRYKPPRPLRSSASVVTVIPRVGTKAAALLELSTKESNSFQDSHQFI